MTVVRNQHPRVPEPRAEGKPAMPPKPPMPSLHQANTLEPQERGEFVTRHATEILVGLNLINTARAEAEKRTTRAALIGNMFSELGMFGDPPPKDIPAGFTDMVEQAEEDSRDDSISRLLIKHEEHPSVMAMDTVIDLVGKEERTDAIQLLRAAAVLIERSEER